VYFGFSEVKRIDEKFICLEQIISEKTEGHAAIPKQHPFDIAV